MIDKYFIENEYLATSLKNYNFRSSQLDIAKLIWNSFDNYLNSVIEAPTGSGKTIAYLVPALASEKKIIISTKSKQLMNQLLVKDIPTVQAFLGMDKSIKLLKGRKNYFCLERYYRLVAPNILYYQDALAWYEENINKGIVYAPWGKLDNEVTNLMSADRFQCKFSKCVYYEDCPFYLERREANDSDIIITNHHMLLSDIALKLFSGQSGTFEFRDHAIFDEAHSLTDIFAQYAGTELSLFGITLFFKENRSIYTLEELKSIQDSYVSITEKVKDSKILYSNISNEIEDFINLGKNIVARYDDKDLQEEYKRYEELLKVISSEDEGLKIVERIDHRITVKLIPVDTGESFSEGLKQSVISSVFISATLSSNGDFKYFLSETGLSLDNIITKRVSPVFDFKSQGILLIPKINSYKEYINVYLDICNNSEGGVLIICNSLERMLKVGEMLKKYIKDKNILFQTDLSLSLFDITEKTVLVGCALLREGIDFSGSGFKVVILDKLPFEYPDDLFLKSKAEKVEREIGNSFINFYLPRAVLYFKQAAGRLIRHEDSKGAWVVLDDRILTKSYGKYFLDVLDNVNVVRSIDEIMSFITGGKL